MGDLYPQKGELFHEFFDLGKELKAIVDREGCLLSVNQNWKALLGYPLEKIEGKPILEWIHPSDFEKFHQYLSEVLERREDPRSVLRLVGKDGSERFVEMTGALSSKGEYWLNWGRDCTEEIKARRVFQESLALAQVGSWELDVKTGKTWWSDEVFRIYEIEDHSFQAIEESFEGYHSGDRRVLEKAIAKAVEKGEPFDLKLRFTTQRGNHLHIQANGKPILEKGEVVRLVGSFQDITTQRRYEETLQAVLDIMPIPFAILTIDGQKTIYGNSKYLDFFSQATQTCHLKGGVASYFETEEVFHSAIKEAQQTGIYNRDLSLSIGGESKVISATMEICRFHGGKALALAFLDVTENVKFLERLSEEEGKYVSLVESLQYAVITIDEKGTIQSANNTTASILGYESSELIGQNMRAFFSDSDQNVSSYWSDFLKASPSHALGKTKELQVLQKGGDTVPVEVGIGSFSYNGEPHFVVCIQDIRDRKEAEEITLKTTRLAIIGEMAAGVGHEIKNPLAIIQANADKLNRLIKGEFDHGQIEKVVEHQKIAIKRIVKIVNGLRNVSRVGDHEEKEIFSVNDMMQETYDLVHQIYSNEGIQVNLLMEASFPMVFGNIGKVQQVLMNFISNARDALEDNQQKTIQLKTRNSGEWVIFEVSDTGCGIPEEIKQKIFETFFTTKERGKGTGLGLGISISIIEDMGGKVEVDSEENKGSTFRVNLPIYMEE